MMSSALAIRAGLSIACSQGLRQVSQLQVRHAKTAQPGLGFRAVAGRTLVPDLATRTRGGTGERRDRRGMVVGLDLDLDMGRLLERTIVTVGIAQPACCAMAFDDSRIVMIGREHTARRTLMRVTNHAEQRAWLQLPVESPVGIEDLVPAVLGVGLGEHHQLGIDRVACQPAERLDQIVDFVFGQGQTELAIGRDQRAAPFTEQIDRAGGLRCVVQEESRSLCRVIEQRFGHAIVQQCQHGVAEQVRRAAIGTAGSTARFAPGTHRSFGELLSVCLCQSLQIPDDAALHPADLRQCALAQYVRGLR